MSDQESNEVVEVVEVVDVEALQKSSGWVMALGVLLILLGFVAIGSPFMAGTATAIWIRITTSLKHPISTNSCSSHRSHSSDTSSSSESGSKTKHKGLIFI